MSNPSVNYNGSRIIPGPFVDISQETVRAQDSSKLGILYTLTLTGSIVAHKGSPRSDGSLWTTSGYPPDESIQEDSRLAAIERKIESLKNLFSVDYGSLEFQSADGSAPLKANVRVKSLNFDSGPWHDVCSYTIVCEADSISGLSSDTASLITSASENWSISEGDTNRTYRVVHTMSASARSSNTVTGVSAAKSYVTNTLVFGLDGNILTGSAFPVQGLTLSSDNVYNYTLEESEDVVAGSYQATETWTLTSLNNVIDSYNISVKKLSDEPNSTTVATINGNIRGFYVNLGDFDTRYTKALSYWQGLGSAALLARCSAVAGISLDSSAIVAEVEYNQFDGVITYNYAFSDRNYNSSTIDTYTISKEQSLDDYKTTVTIEGTIEGRRFETDNLYSQKFDRAVLVWNTIKSPTVMLARITNSTLVSEIADLRTNPISNTSVYDKANGRITYTYRFDNRKNDGDNDNEDVRETYSISKAYSREDGLTTYTINGTVEGLRVVEQNSRDSKYNVALNYYKSYVVGNFVTRIQNKLSVVIANTNPISIEEEYNTTLGTITYTYRYNTVPLPVISTALSEKITVTESNHDGDINIIAEIAVPGRTAGPIFQDMNTTPKKTISVEIEAAFVPLAGTDWAANYQARPDYSSYINSIKGTVSASQVFKENDVFSWDWRSGRYSRSVTWSYQ